MKQIMKLMYAGKTYIVNYDCKSINAYKVYVKYYDDGWHRRKLNEFGDLLSVFCLLLTEIWGFKDYRFFKD